MNREPTNAEKLGRLPWSIAFNAANSVFVQLTFFGSAFVLFLSELGLSKTQIGTLLSLLPFFGLIALFIAPTVARFGYKRAFLTFWGARTLVTAFLLLTPWILSSFGSQAVLVYVVGIVTAFALCRAIALTALYPWSQEYVPNTVRGKYSAKNNIVSSLTAFLAVAGAGYVLGPSPDLGRFMVLFAAGLFFGLISIWVASFIPGGAPAPKTEAEKASRRDLMLAARDKNFLRYLVGVSLIILASGPLASFLPLFMQEQVGLSSRNVVLLQTGTLLGGLLSSYLWGWAADRYGSKPVMLSGVFLMAVLPICWWLMPRQTAWSLHVALGIAFLQGLVNLGWAIGSARLLFVSVVPPEKKTEYMALYYAWTGIVGGLGQLIGGRLLDHFAGISGQFLFFTLDRYTVLFVAGLTLPVMSSLLFKSVRADSAVSVGEFAGMFLRGNPFVAMESLIRYHRAKDERATVAMTERLGQTKSPLTVDELVEALSDPRFFVRFEAIVSISRRGPDARLIEALIKVLSGGEPALSVIAAWALGRIGDRRAIEPLRASLEARYRSVQAHCARALGTLGDAEIVPLLLERLTSETDNGLRMAYAAALGKLRVKEATTKLLTFLRASPDEDSRMELALALARIVGDEHHFIQLSRHVRAEPGTAASQAVTLLKKKVGKLYLDSDDLLAVIDDCAESLARDDLERGAALLGRIIRSLPAPGFDETCTMILQDCAERLNEFGARRIEYLLLALHTMSTSW